MELERHLVLNKYFLNLFGFSDFNELREKLKDTEEGYDSRGRSYFVDVLIGLKPEWEDLLLRYDEAIREYVERLRHNRRQPNFNLKYFQYLAVLFTEIFLDKYYNNRDRFINDLNEFLEKFNDEKGIETHPFTEEDLRKLAFWMATGSGKTLIMHINYWQILKYSRNNWDNIILITPNDGLSRQHYEELKLSGIPCKLYDGNINNLKTKDKEILVIDIHKLTREKKGEGVSVDISYFDGKNLVFIDEGHKGAGGEKETGWKNIREETAKNGFIFEYSATFGQIIVFTKSGRPKGGKSNQTNLELYNEYTKAIIFNYSYKYFYTDGYGKDFYVYNIKEDAYTEEQRNMLLIAGLLSFYEQLVIYKEHKEDLREYNIEKPLWVFVGSKVTGEGLNSDIIKIIQFFHKIIKDENYLKENAEKILNEKSDLIDNKGDDIFKGKFEYIKNRNIEDILEDIYQKVFGGKGSLEVYNIKNAEGEIGLKTGTSEKYFGVINVGDTNALKKLILKSDIEVKEDHFSQSLFSEINENSSHINILIGSKKFIEGWNSWRVSNMGLINMGKSEGPQIIQLFGRGVRLKGKDYSLKREQNPDYTLKVIQTLFIFGLNADYMNVFLKTIEKEEVDYEEITIPIRFNMPEKWEGKIYTIETKDDFDFLKYPVKLTFDENLLKNIKIDLRPKITMSHGLKVKAVDTSIDQSLEIPESLLDMIDWNAIYLETTSYKITKGFYNLTLDKKVLKEIIKSRKYQVFMNKTDGIEIKKSNNRSILEITSFDGVIKLHEILLMVIKDYIFKFYRREEKRKTMDYLEPRPLTREYESMFPENKKIILKVNKEIIKDFEDLIKQIEEYNKDKNKIPDILKSDIDYIPTIYFDKHLYAPLVTYKAGRKEDIKSVPVKLNRGETSFIKDLKNFINRNKSLFANNEIFLLRNLSKRGIGFFMSAGFYPDFIIWVKDKNKQNIIFIDPKGIRNLGNFDDEKIQLCVHDIKDIESRVNEKLSNKNEKLSLHLDAFIISVSSYDDVKTTFGNGDYSKDDFESHNIIFQEKRGYIEKLFKKAKIY